MTKIAYCYAGIFFILNTVWGLPETIFIRNLCLILGSFLTLALLIIHKNFKVANSIKYLIAVFLYATLLLLFVENNRTIQLFEYLSIWKRALFSVLFGFGFGLSISDQTKDQRSKFIFIIFLGIAGPLLVWLFKYFCTFVLIDYSWEIPEYLILWRYADYLNFYIPKSTYVSFLIPIVGASIGLIDYEITTKNSNRILILIYILAIFLTIFCFIHEGTRNGIIYVIFLVSIYVYKKITFLKNFYKSIFLVIMLSISIGGYFYTDTNLKNFLYDSRVALQIQNYQNWKNADLYGLPNNQNGQQVNGSTYERISWSLVGLKLLAENPFGYGLIERSFGAIAKAKWPDSKLTQSHSGWIDLGLGLGIPGLALIFLAMRDASKFAKEKQNQYSKMFRWILLGIFLMWFTTELSQKVYFEQMLFWIALSTGLGVNINKLAVDKNEKN